MTAEFRIYGIPAPQGSKTRMPNGAMVEGSSTSGRVKLRDWRSACATTAAEYADEHQITFTGPCRVGVVFRFPVPKSRSRKIDPSGAFKPTKPDLDKLQRALGDALVAGGLVARDEHIVWWEAQKLEVPDGEWTGALVEVDWL